MDRRLEKYIKEYEQHCIRIKQATSINIHESVKEKSDRMKKLEGEYAKWFEYYFPSYAKNPCAWFHKRMAKAITDNPVISFLAEIYRSGAKSVHLDMGIPMYLYIKGELNFMLLVGETETKAKKLISDIQAQFEHNQRFINDYGRKFKYGHWADGDFTTTDGAKFMALGFGQSPRGVREGAFRPDYIVVDDIDNKKRCNNDRLSREAYEWVWEDLQGCFEEGAERRRFVVANNNFHKNTVINKLKQEFKRINKEAKELGEEKRHYVLTVPAVKDLETFEPNWPEKTSSNYWKKKFRETPYRSFMREYMHKHIQDGTIFKNKYIRWGKVPRLDSYDGLILYGDLSYKATGDYKAMVLLGKKGKDFYVIRVFDRKTSRANAAIWLYDVYEEMNLERYNITYMIEGLFAQDELVNDFDEEGEKRGYYIPVQADTDPKPNKFDRIESMEGFFQRGNVIFNIKYKGDTDFVTLLDDQLLPFEKGSGANDDGPDALQSGISKLNRSTFVEKFKPIIITRKTLSHKSKNRY